MTWSLWFIAVVAVTSAKLLPAAVRKHVIVWDGGVEECNDFSNEDILTDDLYLQKKNRTVVVLKGDAKLLKTFRSPIRFKLLVEKMVNGNWEYYFNHEEADLCPRIKQTNKPWTPFIKEMKVTGCPIEAETYTLKETSLDLAGFPLTVANKGSYRGRVDLFAGSRRAACMVSHASVEPA